MTLKYLVSNLVKMVYLLWYGLLQRVEMTYIPLNIGKCPVLVNALISHVYNLKNLKNMLLITNLLIVPQ
jgi:hypothetical protein